VTQRDFDRFLVHYHFHRSQQRYRLKGRAPAQAVREALGIEELPPIVPAEEEATEQQPNVQWRTGCRAWT